jgi:hypothetical protein
MADHKRLQSLYFAGDYDGIIRSLLPKSISQYEKRSATALLEKQEALFFLSAAMISCGQAAEAEVLLSSMDEIATAHRESWTVTRLMAGLAMAILHRRSEAARFWAAAPKSCYGHGTRMGFDGWFQIFVASVSMGLDVPDWKTGLTQMRKKLDITMTVDGSVIADFLLEKLSIAEATDSFRVEYARAKNGIKLLAQDMWMLRFYSAMLEYYFDEISKSTLCRRITLLSRQPIPELTFEFVFARCFQTLDRV